MSDAGIVRNRAKILAVINNAQIFLEIQAEFGSFDKYIWQFVGGSTIVRTKRFDSYRELPTKTKEAEAMSRDLRQKGFKFIGPTICYAYMQSMGMVDDHMRGCWKATK